MIDAKRYRGKIEVREPLFGKATLIIAGRDRTKLADGLGQQVSIVNAVLAHIAPEVSVNGCFCFVPPEGLLADSGLPVIRTLKINGYPLYYPRRLARRLRRPGSLTRAQASQIHSELARQLALASIP